MGVAPGRCEGGVHCWLIGLELDPELMEWEGVRAMAGCFSAGFSRICQYHYFYDVLGDHDMPPFIP